ncbi:MAG: ATP phosphoribosyltransferase regulatory subunit, partial [Clostridia bacterium]|nr:ATP phosphoribosyltransferase regulatory subunit [Clostridia bacterium]
VVGAVIDALGVGEDTRAAVLSALGSKNPHGLRAALSAAEIGEEEGAPLLSLIGLSGAPASVLPALRETLSDNAAALAALDELSAVVGALGALPGLRLDFSVIHDMQYYNGVVFRGFLPGVASGILSGGQYDRLVRNLGRAEGACGFAVYLDLLDGRREPTAEDADLFLLYSEEDDPATVLSAAAALREGGKRVATGRVLPQGYRAGRIVTLGEVTK